MPSARVAVSRPGPPLGALAALVLGCFALPDVGFRDAGELGTAAFGLGVAHPTGFAVDLLLLRAASLLPLGNIAFRQNLCVALTAGLALGLLAGVAAVVLGEILRPRVRTVNGLAAATEVEVIADLSPKSRAVDGLFIPRQEAA